MSKHSGVLSEAQATALLSESLPAEVSPNVIEAMRTWIVLMSSWNQKTDLTAATGPSQLVDLAVADAVRLMDGIEQGAKVVDVGSGAGAPGLPLAILRSDLKVTLVEPLRKRVAFLRTVIGTIGLTNCDVMAVRGEQAVGRAVRVDVAVSRATLEPEAWLQLGRSLVDERTGAVALLLARHAPPEQPPGLRLRDCQRYVWPLTEVVRQLCWYDVADE